MKAWRAETFGEAVDVLKQVEVPVPAPTGDQIQVKVSAAGVGLPDVLMIRGNYPAVSAPPVSPGQEVVGTVTAAGPEADARVGEKVMTSTLFAAGFGGFSEYCLATSRSAMAIPKTFSDEEAAGFFVPYHTGYVGLVQRGQIRNGETLLVLGGAGSSGSAAIMLGKAFGATVIATASSEEKAAFCRSLGADHVVNYSQQPIHKAVRELTGGAGAQIVYDPVGGSAYESATKCVAQHGRIIFIGYGSGSWPKVDPLHVVLKSYSLVGAFAGARTEEETRAHHAHLVELAEAGKIRVPVDKVFDFGHVPQAIDRVAKGDMLGKVVVRL
ncbi:MAG: zinc-binding dehydrogenase [Alphaproteobacteria bacterium]|nr:zinc-binding dehydrogenase [Alphaproteobacteria bacterium]